VTDALWKWDAVKLARAIREDLTLARAEAIEARAPRLTPIDPRL
jgi:hypothetical protein